NQSASVGTVEKGDKDLQLRVAGEFGSIEAIEQTVLQTEEGATLHVEDVAEVKDTLKTDAAFTLVNGEQSIVLSVIKKTDSNTVEVANNITSGIDQLTNELPSDVQLDPIIDTSEFIQMSIDSVIENILIGGAIAVFILLLFLKSIRATIVIGLSIPIA